MVELDGPVGGWWWGEGVISGQERKKLEKIRGLNMGDVRRPDDG